MQSSERASLPQGDLYHLLCLLMTACCVWLVGEQLNLFDLMGQLASQHGMSDIIMLGFCMSFGLYVAALRASRKMRSAMQARDHAQQEADANARHDSMTGLANRRHLKEILDQRLVIRDNPGDTALILINLDRLKPINDLHGQAAGDAVLIAVAERLRALLPRTAIPARVSGDEFAAVVEYDGNADALAKLCRHLIAGVAQPLIWRQLPLDFGATAGVAIGVGEERTGDALLHAADVALSEGKKSGGNTVRFFHSSMDASLKLRAILERELRAAIGSGEIEPYFQPLVSLDSQRLRGFEVLARWQHPTRGLLLPQDFLTIAEETGMIGDMCRSIVRQACLAAQSWPKETELAINIAPQQLYDRSLPSDLASILAETGFAPSRLEVEITETALIADIDSARTALEALRNLGMRIALDDFGTGYAGLNHLRELKFDKLKIDRSYVAALNVDHEQSKLVDAIIGLGRSLGMTTTAEGIESDGSIDRLVTQGCTYGQGFLFGKPMSRAHVDRWIAEQAKRDDPALALVA